MTDEQIGRMTDRELELELKRLQAVFDKAGGTDEELGQKIEWVWAHVESRKTRRIQEDQRVQYWLDTHGYPFPKRGNQ